MNALELERLNAGQVGSPVGFAQVFKGWNVWAVLAKDSLDFDPLMLGVSPERRLRIWVEEQADKAPGVAVADPANPFALKGGQVEMMQSAEGLESDREMPGGSLLLDGPSTRVFVRFFNRGEAAVTPWPRDANFLLDTVYTPDAENPLTNASPPASLGGAASGAADKINSMLTAVAIVGGVAIGAYVLVQILNARKAAAA